jgi:hypothetical protein
MRASVGAVGVDLRDTVQAQHALADALQRGSLLLAGLRDFVNDRRDAIRRLMNRVLRQIVGLDGYRINLLRYPEFAAADDAFSPTTD